MITSTTQLAYEVFPQPMRPYELEVVPHYDGDYWQVANPDEVTRTIRECSVFAENPKNSDIALTTLQNFIELNWIRPHGHPLTVYKMIDQLIGEFQEFHEVNPNPALWARSPKLKGKYPEAVSELGDVHWYMAAIATSVSVDIQTALKSRLNRDLKHFKLEETTPTVGSLDRLIVEGYTPRLLAPQPGDVAADIFSSCAMVGVSAGGIMDTINDDNDLKYIASRKELMEIGLGHGVGMIAFHANLIGSSYKEVVATNIRKLLLRAEKQTLEDKTKRDVSQL